jgi:sugar-specific transcriptional regulator TrmB
VANCGHGQNGTGRPRFGDGRARQSDEVAQMLDPLLSPIQELVYLALLNNAGADAEELAASLGRSPSRIRNELRGLEHMGLASRTPGPRSCYLPTPPDIGLAALAQRHRDRVAGAEAVAAQLTARFPSRAHPPERSAVVEVIEGEEAVGFRSQQLQAAAASEVLLVDTPPYHHSVGEPNQTELDALARGVTYRVLYDQPALDATPGRFHQEIQTYYLAAGEQGRYIPSLPAKLLIVDRQIALTPLDARRHTFTLGLLVRQCSLLDMLLLVFETLWKVGQPLTSDRPAFDQTVEADVTAPLSSETTELLRLLALGFKDEAAARHLGQNYRSVRRRIATAMTALDAKTRFQAGANAAKRNWI